MIKISIGVVDFYFGVDCDFKVRGFANNNSHVPEIDKSYKFDPETTLAILAAFTTLSYFSLRLLLLFYLLSYFTTLLLFNYFTNLLLFRLL